MCLRDALIGCPSMAYLEEGGLALLLVLVALLALLTLLAFGSGCTSGGRCCVCLDMDLYNLRNRKSVIEGRRRPQDAGGSRRPYSTASALGQGDMPACVHGVCTDLCLHTDDVGGAVLVTRFRLGLSTKRRVGKREGRTSALFSHRAIYLRLPRGPHQPVSN